MAIDPAPTGAMRMSAVRVAAENVTLQVPIFVQKDRKANSWSSMLFGAAFDPPRREFRSLLQDVSFEANEGDRVAILGRNGAGKSTLLRVLNGVFEPNRGRVVIEGSCQALLNISLGFSPDATVRENIFLRGTAMGMKTVVLRELIDSILDFAELNVKAGHRLRTLSSGQRMRLGFSISTAVQHDIMLMDEWVGAGDSDFMAKAKERMHSRVGGSKIVVLASHSVGLLRDVCNKGIVLEGGRLVYSGDIGDALKEYQVVLAMARRAGLNAASENTDEHDARTETHGSVEDVVLSDGRVLVKGWALKGFVRAPAGLALQVGDFRVPASSIEWVPRRDVQKHFGLYDPNCGYRAVFAVPGLASLDDFGVPRMFGGDSELDLDGPFRVAPALAARFRSKAPDRDGDA
jgi:ABC-type polysaccharide/polyol phosphate transport system ATPase subunit